jgi:hypothetical protein
MKRKLRIGEFLVTKKILTPQQVDRILEYSQMRGLRFGEAGLELGLLSREAFIQVFGPTFDVDFFHLNSAYFPEMTQNLIPPEMIVKYGVLPLGFKNETRFLRSRRMLNVGFLSPYRTQFISDVESFVLSHKGEFAFEGIKVYLILADQFLRVLKKVYSISEQEIRSRSPEAVDPTLLMFIDESRERRAPAPEQK